MRRGLENRYPAQLGRFSKAWLRHARGQLSPAAEPGRPCTVGRPPAAFLLAAGLDSAPAAGGRAPSGGTGAAGGLPAGNSHRGW